LSKNREEIGKKIEEGISKINEGIEEIVRSFNKWVTELQKEGINVLSELKKNGIEYSEETIRKCLWGLIAHRILVEKVLGRTLEEDFLIEEYNLTIEEARYVVENPCLAGPPEKCEYWRKHSQCGPCCTLRNGWLYLKTSANGKIKPNWKALAQLPKDTLFIHENLSKEEIEKKVKDFLEEP
jgi:hypothetical protein